MNTKTKSPVALAIGAAVLLASAHTAQAAQQDRDLDGHSVVDAFYDSDRNITWLRNANVNGQMTWDAAVAWADGFSFAGYDDWRLPAADPKCLGWCFDAEMGHLWHVELGNDNWVPTSTGGFQNLQLDNYWSGTEAGGGMVWMYTMAPEHPGAQTTYWHENTFYAMAVRDGDVAVVPEPQTYALLLAGLTALALVRWRRPG